jgi:signal transduction histidine kinase
VVGALSPKREEPFEQVLVEAARTAARRYGAAVDMEIARGIPLAPHEKEAIVRIASEAVTNAARHSGASRLRLALERAQEGVRLRVADDGVGFDTGSRGGHGFGLIGMRDRAEALGAKLSIHSRRGAGTEVELEL